MNMQQKAPIQNLEKALIVFYSLLVLSLLIIFAVEPSIYTKTLTPGATATERYPLPAILFLIALIVFIGFLLYGIVHRWRWLFWGILIASAGSVIQVPVEILQLTGVLPNTYPIWYSLFRALVGVVELGFAFWMVRTYRYWG